MEKLKISNILLITLISILVSSCMVAGPGHIAGNHHIAQSNPDQTTYYDPVCGNPIDISDNQKDLSWQYEGNIYYFHTADCMDKFKASTDKYMQNSRIIQHQHTMNAVFWGLGGLAMGAMMIFMVMH